MHEVTERLYLAAKNLRATEGQSAVAKLLNESPQVVKNWEGRGVSKAGILKAASVLGARAEWLANGTGAMAAAGHPTNVEPGPDMRGKVPLISWVRAGSFCEAADPFVPGDAERWMECPVNHSETTFALRVRGDSMTAPHGNGRTYPEGCIIFVDPEKRSPVNGDRIVACLDGSHEVTFKVYKNEDGRQWLQPLNPTHEPIREPFKVLGTVLGKWEDG